MFKLSSKPHFKTTLVIVWFAFTFSLVAWWWVFFLQLLSTEQTRFRMIAWEGSILLTAIAIGGVGLLILSIRDEKRHRQLKVFFATFSHDIKTSIARLRLQAEVIEEELDRNSNPIIKRLIEDIQRLDLQLENSLLLASTEKENLLSEEIQLSDLFSSLRNEFPELAIELNRDALVLGDRRALLSVFKNMLHNSVLHGKANTVKIFVAGDSGNVTIDVKDNGLGFKGPITSLGAELLISQQPQSNGIGLLLTSRLVQAMGGKIVFSSKENEGFVCTVRMRGQVL